MIHRLKSDHAVIVDALELQLPIAFYGIGPFSSGHQMGGKGDWLVIGTDGQRILHAGEFEAYELVPVAPVFDEAPLLVPAPAPVVHHHKPKAKREAASE